VVLLIAGQKSFAGLVIIDELVVFDGFEHVHSERLGAYIWGVNQSLIILT
jgi:hypothetical protein